MKHQSHLAWRSILLSAFFISAAAWTMIQLFSLHLFGKDGDEAVSYYEPARSTERILANRGLIMDREEDILTNNIRNARIVANRYHLRDITVVLDGLSYNLACHDKAWAESTPEQRDKLISLKKRKLLKLAQREMTAEERRAQRVEGNGEVGKAIKVVSYKPEVVAQYIEQHDALIANLLYPYLHQEMLVECDEQGQETQRPITREDIVELIAQTETQQQNAEAEANGLPTRNLRQNIILSKNITHQQGEEISRLLQLARIRGVSVESNARRFYVQPEKLSHILGYVNAENVGMNGIERVFQSYLAGTHGLRERSFNSQGQVRPSADDRYLAPKHGLNVQLTIDMAIQQIAEEELDRGLLEFNAPQGCVIIVDPKTGDILGMASRPSFNLNTKEVITPQGTFSREEMKKLLGKAETGEFNYALQGRYEPGSTFKVIAAAGVVNDGLMSFDTPVDCSRFTVGGAPVSDGRRSYSVLPLWAVLKKSSNPGTVRAARALGWPRYRHYMKEFGILDPADVDLPNGGAVLMTDGSNSVNFSRMAFGYSIAVSPLHMAMVYAAIANDGIRMKPRIIKDIIDEKGESFESHEPIEAGRVMSQRTAKGLRAALETVTEKAGAHGQGTAMRAAIPGFRVGGKTGTAEKLVNGQYHDSLYTVSFAGMIPADKPEFVIMVVIDNPKPKDIKAAGGTVAAPIFRKVAERLISLRGLTPHDAEAYAAYLEEQKKLQSQSIPTASPH